MDFLNENLEYGDLKRLIHPELHIDEYASKMGDDDEVAVLSFKVGGKQPAADLIGFIEKGYNWVLDADVSSGELDDGDYLVFVEAPRRKTLPDDAFQLVTDILNLTEQKIEEWTARYQGTGKDMPLTLENLTKIIPLSPKEYRDTVHDKYEDEPEADVEDDLEDADGAAEEKAKGDKDLDAMKATAGVPVTTKAPKNDFTESLRIAAGLK